MANIRHYEIPKSVLECGGLIGRIMDYTLDQSYRPNKPLAFAGAVTFIAHCMARRYRTKDNCRPNIYFLAHAWSGVGKSAPRETNTRLAKACGLIKTVIDDFRSGEALQDTVLTYARVLSQYDEVDGLFDMIKHARDTVGINTMGEMLKLWEKSRSFLARRRLAASVKGRDKDPTPNCCHHAHFSLLATGVTNEVYKSISDKMAKNGFFARLIVIDGGSRGEGRAVTYRKPPTDIVDDCKQIAGYTEIAENWKANDPLWDETGGVINMDAEAEKMMAEVSAEADDHYDTNEDGVNNAIWNRTAEKVKKMAMIFAMSDNPGFAVIRKRDIELARDLVYASNEQQIGMLTKYSAETEYEDLQKKVLRILEKGITCNRAILARLHIKADEMKEVAETLHEAGKIIYCEPNGEEISEWKKGISYALA